MTDMIESLYKNSRDHPPPTSRTTTSRPPWFDDKGDVHWYILHFQEVAETIEWPEVVALLSLRESLIEDAKESTRANLEPYSWP